MNRGEKILPTKAGPVTLRLRPRRSENDRRTLAFFRQALRRISVPLPHVDSASRQLGLKNPRRSIAPQATRSVVVARGPVYDKQCFRIAASDDQARVQAPAGRAWARPFSPPPLGRSRAVDCRDLRRACSFLEKINCRTLL